MRKRVKQYLKQASAMIKPLIALLIVMITMLNLSLSVSAQYNNSLFLPLVMAKSNSSTTPTGTTPTGTTPTPTKTQTIPTGTTPTGTTPTGTTPTATTPTGTTPTGTTPTTPTGTTPTETPTEQPSKWVMAYYVGYQRDLLPPSEIDWSTLTHIVVGRVLPNNNGTLNTNLDIDPENGPALARELAQRAHANGRKALLMLGGADTRDGFVSAASPQNRAQFVQNIVATVNELGYDGIDMDWEPIEQQDRQVLLNLLDEIRAAKPDIIISIPVGWVSVNYPDDFDEYYVDLAERVDQMNIMSYYMSGNWGWLSWHSSPLFGEAGLHPTSIHSSVQHYLDLGIPAAKLGVGTGFFGQCWGGITQPRVSMEHAEEIASDNVMSYTNIHAFYLNKATRIFDSIAKVPYLSSEIGAGPRKCNYLSYEDEQSIIEKGKYVHEHGLGGTIIWTINQGYLSYEDQGKRDPLMQAIKHAFLGGPPPPPATATPTPTITPTPSDEKWVSAYYVGYQRDLLPADQIDWTSLTHLIVGRILPENDGSINTYFDFDTVQGPIMARDLAQRAHANNRKALLMLGGYGAHQQFVSAASPQNRANFVQNLVAVVEDLGYDGIDVDWEPITTSDRATVLALLRELRAAKPDIILTIPVGWANKNYPEDIDPYYKRLAELVDQMNIMSYGMSGAWGWDSWHSSALHGEEDWHPTSINNTVQLYLDLGIPAGKIGVGTGFYGQCWRGVFEPRLPLNGAEEIANDNIMSYANIRNDYLPEAIRYFDDIAKVPFLSSDSMFGPQGCTYVSYEDEQSIMEKGAFVHEKGLGGTIIWTINQGHLLDAPAGQRDPLMQAIKYAFLDDTIPQPTTPTPAPPTPTPPPVTPTPPVPTPQADQSKWVMPYYVGYQRDLLPADQIDWTTLTHIVVGRALPNYNGTINTNFDIDFIQGPAMARELSTLAHANGRKALLMLGGAGTESGFVSAASPRYRAAFVRNLINTIDDLGYDGVDIDWEPLREQDQPNMLALVQELRLARPDLIITMPVFWLNINFQDADPFYAELATYLDRVNIMSYGMSGDWGWDSWHSSALYGEQGTYPSSINSSVDKYLEIGIPSWKLGIGSGFYGQCWAGVTQPRANLNNAQEIANDNHMSFTNIRTLYQAHATRIFDTEAGVPFLSSTTPFGPLACNYISYEDEESLGLKGEYIQDKDLGALIIWTINQGYLPNAPLTQRHPLMQAVKESILQ